MRYARPLQLSELYGPDRAGLARSVSDDACLGRPWKTAPLAGNPKESPMYCKSLARALALMPCLALAEFVPAPPPAGAYSLSGPPYRAS